MDAYYASVEQRDNPELRGRPIAVGGSPTGRGVVATCSYEARKFGVHSAMPSATALRLCPQIIFVRPRFDLYNEISHSIREIFHRYTDLVEPLSLDEAYLDVTENKLDIPYALRVAHQIRMLIKEELDLTATAGVSYCKFLAKMASGYQKPNGLNFIPEETAQIFIDQLEVGKFHGIGKKTALRMKDFGIHTGKDLREKGLPFLVKRFGKAGRFYHAIANGLDDRDVKPHRQRKSASVEDTFSEDIEDMRTMDEHIERMAQTLMRRLDGKGLLGRTVNLKVKFANFQTVTRAQSFSAPVTTDRQIATACKELLRNTEAGTRKVRLLGVGVSNFEGVEKRRPGDQLSLEL